MDEVNNTVTITALTNAGDSIVARTDAVLNGDIAGGMAFGGYTGSAYTDHAYKYSVSGTTITWTDLTVLGETPKIRSTALGGTKSNTEGWLFGGTSTGTDRLTDFYDYKIEGDNIVFERKDITGDFAANPNTIASIEAHAMGDKDEGVLYVGHGKEGGAGTLTLFGEFFHYKYSKDGSFSCYKLNVTGDTFTKIANVSIVGNKDEGIFFGGILNLVVSNKAYKIKRYNDELQITALTIDSTGETPAARQYAGIAGDATKGVIHGGRTSSATLNDAYSYEVTGSTIKYRSLSVVGSGKNKAEFAMAGNAEYGIIYGGSEDAADFSNDIFKYFVTDKVFSIVPLNVTGDSLPGARGSLVAGDGASGIIYGGWSSGTALNDNNFRRYVVNGSEVNITSITPDIPTTKKAFGAIAGDVSGIFIAGGEVSGSLSSPNGSNDYWKIDFPVDHIEQKHTQDTILSTEIADARLEKLFSATSSNVEDEDFFIIGKKEGIEGSATWASSVTDSDFSARKFPGVAGDGEVGIVFGGWGLTVGGNLTRTNQNDFIRYDFRSGNSITGLTKAGSSIPAMGQPTMTGNAYRGIIYGGGRNFYNYAVNSAGTTVTVTALTRSGTYPAADTHSRIVGDFKRGLVLCANNTGGGKWVLYNVNGTTVNLTGNLTVRGDTLSTRQGPVMVGNEQNGIVGLGVANSVFLTDFYFYFVSKNTITLRKLGVEGTIPGLLGAGIVGDISSGIIYGGDLTGYTKSTKMYRYVVSGNMIKIDEISISSNISGRTEFGIAGDSNRGVVFGGILSGGNTNEIRKFSVSYDEYILRTNKVSVSALKTFIDNRISLFF